MVNFKGNTFIYIYELFHFWNSLVSKSCSEDFLVWADLTAPVDKNERVTVIVQHMQRKYFLTKVASCFLLVTHCEYLLLKLKDKVFPPEIKLRQNLQAQT